MAWVTCSVKHVALEGTRLPICQRCLQEAEVCGSAPALRLSLAVGQGHRNLGTYVAKTAQGLED